MFLKKEYSWKLFIIVVSILPNILFSQNIPQNYLPSIQDYEPSSPEFQNIKNNISKSLEPEISNNDIQTYANQQPTLFEQPALDLNTPTIVKLDNENYDNESENPFINDLSNIYNNENVQAVRKAVFASNASIKTSETTKIGVSPQGFNFQKEF